jgi:hypothetical protein
MTMMRTVLWLATSAVLSGTAYSLTTLGVSPRWAPLWVTVATAAALLGATIAGLERVTADVPTWRSRAGGPAAALAGADWTMVMLINIWAQLLLNEVVGRYAPLVIVAWPVTYLLLPAGEPRPKRLIGWGAWVPRVR